MPRRIGAFIPPRAGKKDPYIKKENRPTAAGRGYNSREWYALRKQVLVRDSWQCQACGRICVDKREAQVDHIVPKSRGGQDELSNLQTLCIKCHGRKTVAESRTVC